MHTQDCLSGIGQRATGGGDEQRLDAPAPENRDKPVGYLQGVFGDTYNLGLAAKRLPEVLTQPLPRAGPEMDVPVNHDRFEPPAGSLQNRQKPGQLPLKEPPRPILRRLRYDSPMDLDR